MKPIRPDHPDFATTSASRRTFVKGLVAGGAIAGLGLWRPQAWALNSPGQPSVLAGREFDLTVGESPVNYTGRMRQALTVNGTVPGPVLRWREGDEVVIRVKNLLREDTSIHWHGILLPSNMDGVPGLSFHGIRPDETFEYRFLVRQSGTYWYHSHSMFQEQLGHYGALIVDPREPDPIRADRDFVVLLSDWTDEDPHHLYAKLKKKSDYYNRHKRTLGDFFDDVRKDGWDSALADRKAWGEMRMTPTDLADVSAYTYTYLMNGTAPAGNWTGLFRRGERVRLRFVNGSSMTYFDVRIPGLKLTVVAADGQPVRPVTVDEFRIGVAETYDVIVEPSDRDAYTIFAQSMDRSGFARGTLAVREGLAAVVPELDRRPLLTMDDMGHGGHGDGKGMEGGCGANMKGMEGGCGGNMGHAGMSHGAGGMVEHPASEDGNPGVDMQTMFAVPKLDDPGIGLREAQLRENRPDYTPGHRVLTYADLHSTFDDPDGREPSREIELHLTGHMERFVWSFDGIKFSSAEPLVLKYGERVRIVLVNDTMMTHPIHLHGLWSDLEDEHGRFQVRKHTIDMPPGSRRSYRVTADALGRWAYHCHLLYHMESGMFREVRVEE